MPLPRCWNAASLAWVRGEISNFTRAASGHWYFSLKDARAQIRCVMFRGRNQHVDFAPREGEAVEVRALVSMYEARGEVQLNVEAMRRAGVGNLYEAFLRLKESWRRKDCSIRAQARTARPPAHHRRGHFAAGGGARDVLTTLRRRAPHVPVVVYPCRCRARERPRRSPPCSNWPAAGPSATC